MGVSWLVGWLVGWFTPRTYHTSSLTTLTLFVSYLLLLLLLLPWWANKPKKKKAGKKWVLGGYLPTYLPTYLLWLLHRFCPVWLSVSPSLPPSLDWSSCMLITHCSSLLPDLAVLTHLSLSLSLSLSLCLCLSRELSGSLFCLLLQIYSSSSNFF